jgi:hypothetical protein
MRLNFCLLLFCKQARRWRSSCSLHPPIACKILINSCSTEAWVSLSESRDLILPCEYAASNCVKCSWIDPWTHQQTKEWGCQWDMSRSSDFNLFKRLAAQLWGHWSQHEVHEKNTSALGSCVQSWYYVNITVNLTRILVIHRHVTFDWIEHNYDWTSIAGGIEVVVSGSSPDLGLPHVFSFYCQGSEHPSQHLLTHVHNSCVKEARFGCL